jgi:hypothetical protein
MVTRSVLGMWSEPRELRLEGLGGSDADSVRKGWLTEHEPFGQPRLPSRVPDGYGTGLSGVDEFVGRGVARREGAGLDQIPAITQHALGLVPRFVARLPE